jgi:hypothetical protein
VTLRAGCSGKGFLGVVLALGRDLEGGGRSAIALLAALVLKQLVDRYGAAVKQLVVAYDA